MTRAQLDTLKALCDVSAVSGFEREAAEVIVPLIKEHCDRLYYDKCGSLVAFKKGSVVSGNTPVAYFAHLDEVGFMIREIEEDGTLLFEQVGMRPEVLRSKRVLIGKERLPGVIGAKPVHLGAGKEKPDEESLYIDIGARSREEAEKCGVYAAQAVFENDFCVFGDGKLVRSKALDDRFGCLEMVELIKRGVTRDSYFVFTAGEEIGGVSAMAAATAISPAAAVILETTTASDLPETKERDTVCRLHHGAVAPFMDGGSRADEAFYHSIRKIADERGIPAQTKTRIAGGTDAASIQRAAGGFRCMTVSLPCRYIHTASCVAAIDDMDACLALVYAIDESWEALL